MSTDWDWSRFAVGGAARPDTFTGMAPEFTSALQQLFAAAPPDLGLRVSSGYRSNERQAQLWEEALAKYGSPEAARKWVAPPGKSNHNHGHAADLKYLSPEAKAWAHENAAKFGLAFPLGNEDWHVELADRRNPGATPASPMAPRPNPMAAFGDFVAPQPAPQPLGLGDIIARTMQQRQAMQAQRDEEEAAERARKQALFG